MQSGAYVVMTGGLMRMEDMPDDLRALTVEINGTTRYVVPPTDGNSGIIDPRGEYLAGPVLNEEVILTATGNTGTVMLQKMIADHAGHYSRPDVFDFRVNRQPKQIADFGGASREVRIVRRAIEDGTLADGRDLLGALDDLDIDLDLVREERD
jgi:hypothetical protein